LETEERMMRIGSEGTWGDLIDWCCWASSDALVTLADGLLTCSHLTDDSGKGGLQVREGYSFTRAKRECTSWVRVG